MGNSVKTKNPSEAEKQSARRLFFLLSMFKR